MQVRIKGVDSVSTPLSFSKNSLYGGFRVCTYTAHTFWGVPILPTLFLFLLLNVQIYILTHVLIHILTHVLIHTLIHTLICTLIYITYLVREGRKRRGGRHNNIHREFLDIPNDIGTMLGASAEACYTF